jgi:hypothetical protein
MLDRTEDTEVEPTIRKYGPISVEITDEQFTIIRDESGDRVSLGAGAMTGRVASAMWEWQRDQKAREATYGFDTPEGARNVVHFWNVGSASNFESLLIQTYLAADTTLKNRLACAFPAIATAIDNWIKGRG